MTSTSAFDFEVEDHLGRPLSLKDKFGKSGKKCYLVVNVASKCGLTASNYTGLVKLYDELGPKGLEIIAFPCNDFGAQEPGDNATCQAFAVRRKATFPMMGKIHCENGNKTHPLYVFLKNSLPGELCGCLGKKIKWNFTKFLLNEDGVPVSRHGPWVGPSSLKSNILSLLEEKTN